MIQEVQAIRVGGSSHLVWEKSDVEEITAYKLTNGQIMDDKEHAINMQKEIDFMDKLKPFLKKNIKSSEHKKLMFEFIHTHSKELKEILNIL